MYQFPHHFNVYIHIIVAICNCNVFIINFQHLFLLALVPALCAALSSLGAMGTKN